MRTRLRGWARWRLGIPHAEFDDAYQAAWRKTLETERRGRPTRNVEARLRCNIQNAWLEEQRRRRRRPAVSLEEVTEAMPSAFYVAVPDPAELAERRETARYLFEAIGTLTERQRKVLLLRDVGELPPAEVCRRLGIGSTTYRHEHAVAWRKACARVGELLRGDWCERHRDMLDAYAQGSATPAQIHGAQRHLRNCPGCRARVAANRLAAQTSLRDAVMAAS